MKYLIDWIFATLLAIGTLLWIVQEPDDFRFFKLQLRSLDDYPIPNPKETFILHLNTFNCQTCKRDTQVLMRYHLQHPDIPIVDANIVQTDAQVLDIQKWKKKLDIGYTVAIIQEEDRLGDRIPSTFVVDPQTNQIREIFGTLSYEKLLEATEKDK